MPCQRAARDPVLCLTRHHLAVLIPGRGVSLQEACNRSLNTSKAAGRAVTLQQLRQHKELLHQANTPTLFLFSLEPLGQGPKPLPTASLPPGDGLGLSKHG